MNRVHRRAMGIVLLVSGGCAGAPSHSSVPATAATGVSESFPPDESFRAQPPEPDPSSAYRVPPARMTTLPNGMRVLVVERHSTRAVAAELLILGGTSALPDEPPAATELMVDSLKLGTTRRTERDIFAGMTRSMFELELRNGVDWLAFSVRGFSSSFDAALEMLSDVALSPAFPPDAVEAKRRTLLANTAHDADDPAIIGRRNLYAALYGSGHPYARFMATRSGALPRLTRNDVLRVWHATMDPKRAVLVIAGDVEPASAIARIEALFGGWKADPTCRTPAEIPPPSPGARRIIVVDRPKAPQATVFWGAAVPAPASPGFNPTLILHRLWGGMRSSTAKVELRQQLGATSGWARLSYGRTGSTLYWEGSVRRDQTAAFLGELATAIRQLAESGPTAEEAATAIGFLTRSMPRSLETVRSLADSFAGLVGLDLPMDYFETYRRRVEAVPLAAVREAVPDPATMKAVVVGDLASIRGSLLALGWGPLEQRDAEGNFVGLISR